VYTPKMPARQPPYRRLLARTEGVEIWRVDGRRVRDELDVDFTNGAHGFVRRYVPKNEIWLDRDAPGSGEWVYWAVHQLVERAQMARGAPYLTALRRANRAERAERRAAGERPVRSAAVRLRTLGEAAGRTVWLVDGRLVRTSMNLDFTLGGHHLRYRFIPRREIWIDDAVAAAERPAILHHEAIEIGHMLRGKRYDEAHALASRAEARFRRAAAQALT
jgi:hypothetical protein